MNLESILYGACIGVVLGLLLRSLISGQPLSLRLRRPTIWDVVIIGFAVYVPVVGAVIGNGFVASVVVVLTGLALILAWRRYGQPRAEAAPSGQR